MEKRERKSIKHAERKTESKIRNKKLFIYRIKIMFVNFSEFFINKKMYLVQVMTSHFKKRKKLEKKSWGIQ